MSASTSVPRSRRAILPTLGILFALVILFVIFANVFTDFLWYRVLSFGNVFSTMLVTRIGLFLVFGLLLAVLVGGNAMLAWRLRPRNQSMGNPALDRYAEALQARTLPVVIALSVVLFLFGGLAALGADQLFLAWRNATPFGQTDFRFGLDLGFFVFSYPWWRFVIGYLLTALILSAVVAVLFHYLLGGLRLRAQGSGGRATRAANVHVSVLLALVLLAMAASAWFDRYGRAVATNELLTGIRYSDDHATLVASLIIAVIAVLCAVLFAANAVVRRWTIPVVAVVLMMISNIVLGVIYPAIIQGAVVQPNQHELERDYVAEHIAATREAYNIDDVEVTSYEAQTEASAGQLRQDAAALPGVRLMDPAVIGPTFDQLQQVRGFYSFSDVLDVDRYDIEGRETDTVVAVRELNEEALPSQAWNSVRTVYTHGHGMVAAYGNRSSNGEPVWLSQDMPPTGEISDYEPRVYFGEEHTGYSIVGRPAGEPPIELDTPEGGDNGGASLNTYDGTGGVPIGDWFSRILYAIRMGDYNLLLSERVNEESKIIYDRTPRERVEAAAPWLHADTNAFPTVVDGRIKWVVDAYTTSNSYPNSHRVSLQQATADAESQQDLVMQPDDQINYMRNSVKAVVDAYDGTVTLYEWDTEDPILKTWEKAFPGSITPRDEIPEALLEHLRYPEDMFKVQRDVLGRFHVTDPIQWIQGNDTWEVPTDPVDRNNDQKQPPYFLQVRWPEESQPVYSQTATYVPRDRQNLAAFMAVNADATSENYGQIRVLRMTGTQIDGPNQTFNAMVANETVAARLRPFTNSESARISHGNLLTLPVGGGLLYVNPVYTERASSGGGAYPALSFVIVRFGQEVGIGESLDAALDEVFGGDSGARTGENPTQPGQPGGLSADAEQALGEAEEAFVEADEALRNGDLATYQAKIEEARAAIERARGN